MPLLGLKTKRCHRARIKPFYANRLACFLAVPIAPVLNSHQGCVDFRDKLPLSIARPQLDAAIRLETSPVGYVGMLFGVL